MKKYYYIIGMTVMNDTYFFLLALSLLYTYLYGAKKKKKERKGGWLRHKGKTRVISRERESLLKSPLYVTLTFVVKMGEKKNSQRTCYRATANNSKDIGLRRNHAFFFYFF